MILYIFTTHKDLSLPLLLSGAKDVEVETKVIYFSHLHLEDNQIFVNHQLLKVGLKDKILIRWPWDAVNLMDFNYWVKILFIRFAKNIVLDKNVLSTLSPFYEDKLFQSQIFDVLKIPTPLTYFFQNKHHFQENKVSYPLVVKKRISSRSKGNFLVGYSDDVFTKTKNRINKFIFQKKIDFETDIRINILNQKIIGAVTRKPSIRGNNRLSVKVDKLFRIENPQIIKDCLKLSEYLGADFLGVDVILTQSGKYYFLEANLSPQFNRFKEISGIDLGRLVIEAAIK